MRKQRVWEYLQARKRDHFSFPLTFMMKSNNHGQSEYKHSLTFRVWRYVGIASKPVHRLQICHKCTIRGHPLPFPQVTSGSVQ